jgi:hypothetical protein
MFHNNDLVVSSSTSVKISKFLSKVISVGSWFSASASFKKAASCATNLGLRIVQHERTMESTFRASARLIALEYKRGPPTRVLLISPHTYDHPAERSSRQLLHALALMGLCLKPNEDIRERGKDIVLRRYERYLLCRVFCKRVVWMYESCLDDLLSAVRSGQGVLRGAGGEAGRAERGQKGDVESRVEAAVYTEVIGVHGTTARATTYGWGPGGVTHSVKGSSVSTSATRLCRRRKSRKRVFPVWIDSRAASKMASLGGELDDVASSSPVSSKVSRIAVI